MHFVTLGDAPYIDKRFATRFRHNAFFVGPNTREAINEARAEYHAYPEEEESPEILKHGTPVTIRPIKPTDEPLLQGFFYPHSDETVYRRYF